jgi:pimeloyl-ACP methyl ester carboxylesterase/UDP:flavonoid glycosyltransferase YjiC (YdhE family)
MRAREPDQSGIIERDGVKVAYDVYGAGHTPTVVLLPTWAITHAMHWKAQIPVLARRYRVIAMDPRGNGRSDRPLDPAAYTFLEQAADVIAVMDVTGTARATIAGVSDGGVLGAVVAAHYPDRVSGALLSAPALWSLGISNPDRKAYSFEDELGVDEGWALFNEHAWRRDLAKFAQFFWSQVFTEPHSTKQVEDGVGWTGETDAEVLITTVRMSGYDQLDDRDLTLAVLHRIQCPVLLVHGSADQLTPIGRSELIAQVTGWDLLTLVGSGHCPQARDPVRFNRALIEFVERVSPAAERPAHRTTWTRALDRRKRVLYLSSPIGLGHARRDLAIARALRGAHPDVQVDWLAQEPVTTFLAGTGETVHPASRELAGESAHIASESHEHDLNAFQAVRRMDEILVANFSVFQDLADTGDYDLVIADEAWDVDYFWHENPELKRTALAWMTDFVGWLPLPEGGTAEAALTADYNAEMIEHVARFRRLRDRAIFVGDPGDIVEDDFGPGLPRIRAWTEAHFDFCGYITGFEPGELTDRLTLRSRLGYDPDQPLVVVTVGGSGVGQALLRKVIGAFPLMRKQVDDLRMVVVAGPRIDPGSLPRYDGVEVRGYVPDLHLHLAACDAAIVQGGLTTTMELVANRRPFLYFPLGQHFEQQRHVRHRLERHRAGRYMNYSDSDPESIAAALAEQLAAPCDYLTVPADGAARAAGLIAELL